MPERIKKEDVVRRLATRMDTDEATATAWVDGVVETFDELRNYLRPRATGEAASPSEQRRAFLDRLTVLKKVLRAFS